MKLHIFGKGYFPLPCRLEIKLVHMIIWQSFWFSKTSHFFSQSKCRNFWRTKMGTRVTSRSATPLGDPRGIPKSSFLLLRINNCLILGCLEGFGARINVRLFTVGNNIYRNKNKMADMFNELLQDISGNFLKIFLSRNVYLYINRNWIYKSKKYFCYLPNCFALFCLIPA